MLDDLSIIEQRDPQRALVVAGLEFEQLEQEVHIQNEHSGGGSFDQLVVTGMGGSALAAGLAKSWLDLALPFEIVRRYNLPKFVNERTLVIVSSYSGNTEETLAALADAEARGSTIVVLASGGKLIEIAQEKGYPYVQLPSGYQPRMAVLANLVSLCRVLEAYRLVSGVVGELRGCSEWLQQRSASWLAGVPTEQNYAKQLALQALGKTPVIYAGPVMSPVAYKWKIGFNENAKNTAFWNELPEFNHNEFMGWTSHPVEKPFAVFDLLSTYEHERVQRRFEVSDRLLSGLRPRATVVALEGETMLQQMLWGCVLGDFVSIYTALLNGVNPTPVDAIEKLKAELAE